MKLSPVLLRRCALVVVAVAVGGGWAYKPQTSSQQSVKSPAQTPGTTNHLLNVLRNLRAEEFSALGARAQAKAAQNQDFSSIVHRIRQLLGNDGSAITVVSSAADKLGNTHLRLQQYYKGVFVMGADMVVHVDKSGKVYASGGAFVPGIDVDTALHVSVDSISKKALENAGAAVAQIQGNPRRVVFQGKLCWDLTVKSNGPPAQLNQTFFDARTGEALLTLDRIMRGGPGETGSHVPVSGTRLTGEDGTVVGMQGWHDEPGNYFLYNKTNVWRIYNDGKYDWEQRTSDDWGTSDPAAVSLGKNFEVVQDYFRTVAGINSFDNNGAYATAHVHTGFNFVNAYWDGSEFFFGDGDGVTANPLTVIDVAAHEYGHAVTQYTSNLVYMYESGALNESFSDIYGTMVEFWAEPDGRDSYPRGTPGKADWLCGEDCWLLGDALRDFRDPQRCNQPSYYHGTLWFTGDDDNGGVHYNSGVQNHFFYLLAEGGSGVNDGHAYTVDGMGMDSAGTLALYVNRYLLTSSSTYQESRDAWILAAATLGYDARSVADAWNAVGVLPLEKHMAVSPGELAFGRVGEGVADTMVLQLTNSGAGATLVSELRFGGGIFGASVSLPLAVPENGSVALKCTFRPEGRSSYTDTLIISSNADDYPVLAVPLSGEGVGPAVLSVRPTSISMSADVGDSVTTILVAKNAGEADLKMILKSDIDPGDPQPRNPMLVAGNPSGEESYIAKIAGGQSRVLNPTLSQLSPIIKPQAVSQSILYLNTTIGAGEDQFVRGLRALPNVKQLDVVDGRSVTPNADYLLQYDIVILASNTPWPDAATLGDNCAAYVDRGGRVILLVAAIAVDQWGIGGRFRGADYLPITPAGAGNYSISQTFADHPITGGVSTLETMAPTAATTVQGTALSLGTYTTGYLIGAVNQNRPVVAINVFPMDGFWSGDLIRMMGNTIDFLSTKWLTAEPAGRELRIATGDSVVYSVQFNAAKLYGGIYSGSIDLFNNDPANPNPLRIPCTFVVAGVRSLSASPKSIDFGNVWVTTSDTMRFTLANGGTEATRVTSITSDNPRFTPVTALPLVIKPNISASIAAVFSPVDVGAAGATFTITSDAMDNPAIQVTASGNGTLPPVASVSPASIHFSFGPHDMPADNTCVLSNTGGDILSYSVIRRETGSPSINPPPISGSPAPFRPDLIYNKANYERRFALDRVIVRLKDGAAGFASTASLSAIGAKVTRELALARVPRTGQRCWQGGRLLLVGLTSQTREGVLAAIDRLRMDANVRYVEPDYIVRAIGIPNDPEFVKLYGMHNSGQTGGKADADIDAPEAWDCHQGNRSILLALIDTGIDYLHPDLAANIWTNPGEIPGNGADDDGNGFIDDVHGWDFFNDDADPMDDHYHGTHCAGTIGGAGNNGIGVAGVMWEASIMALKFLNAGGSGSTSDAVDAVNYATAMGASLSSNSWGGGGYDQSLADAIAQGGLFIAAAGNNGSDNDMWPNYPASYELDNIISVAATDHNDSLAYFSCYGKTSVDLGAPGVDIFSCAPANGYQYLSGTSMATPHVSGAAGLVWSLNQGLTASQIKEILLKSVDTIPSLQGKTVSEGRLNVKKALDAAGPRWLRVNPELPGIVEPGSSRTFTLTANPAGLVAGRWSANVLFRTNDPHAPDQIVSVVADVSGCRSLIARNPAIDFGTVWSDRDSTISVILVNACNDWVTISALSFSAGEFTSSTSVPARVAPFGSLAVPVRFAPGMPGPFSGRLIVSSDAGDNPSLPIDFTGNAVLPPIINCVPQSVSRTLDGGAGDSARVVLYNVGGADYYFKSRVTFDKESPAPVIARTVRLSGPVSPRADTANRGYEANASALRLKETKLPARPATSYGAVSDAVLFILADSCIRQIDPLSGETIGDSILVGSVSGAGLAYDGEYLFYNNFTGIIKVIDPRTGTLVREIDCPVPEGIDGLGVTDEYLVLGNYYQGTCYVVDKETGEMRYTWNVPGYFGGLGVSSSRNSVFLFNGKEYAVQERSITDGSLINSIWVDFYCYGIGYSERAGLLFCSSWDGIHAIDPVSGTMVNFTPVVANSMWGVACDETDLNPWLTTDTREGVVRAGDSLFIKVTFTTDNLTAATYTGALDIAHAPGRGPGPHPVVPCSLTVLPYNRLSAHPAAISFKEGWVGYTDTLKLVLANSGNAPTAVSSLKLSKGVFGILAQTPFEVPAFDSIAIGVTYCPLKVGKNASLLTVVSNALDNPTIAVALSGVAVTPPKVSFTPTSISRTLMPGRIDSVLVTVTNKGGAAYPFRLRTTSAAGPSSLKDAVLFGTQNGNIFRLDPLTGLPAGDSAFIKTGRDGWGAGLAFDGSLLYYADSDHFQALVFDAVSGVQVGVLKLPTRGFCGLGVSDKYLIAGNANNNTCYVLDKTTGAIVYQWQFQPYFWAGLTYSSRRGTVFAYNSMLGRVEEYSIIDGTVLNSWVISEYGSGLAYSTSADVLFISGWNGIAVLNPNDGSIVASYPRYFDNLSSLAADEAVASQRWLSVRPSEGIVPAKGICSFKVALSGVQMVAGVYSGSVEIVPTIRKAPGPYSISSKLTVLPFRSLTAKPLLLEYGTVWTGNEKTLYVTLENKGSVQTTVSDIRVIGGPYRPDCSLPLVVPPYQTVPLGVIYAPHTPGLKLGALTIRSDAQNLPLIPVGMAGKAVTPPRIEVTPLSLSASLDSGRVDTRTVTIANTGGAPYSFSTKVRFTPTAAAGPKALNAGALFTCNYGLIRQIDPSSGDVLDEMQLGSGTWGEGLAFDGDFLYYIGSYDMDVQVIDLARKTVVRTVRVPDTVKYGFAALGVTDSFIIAANQWMGRCFILDKQTGALVASWHTGSEVNGLSFAASRGTVFLSNRSSGTIEERVLLSGEQVNSFPQPFMTAGIGYSCAANALYAGTSYEGVYVLNPDDGSVLRRLDSTYIGDGGVAADEVRPYSPWLSVTIDSGTVLPQNNLALGVVFNAGALPPGTYQASVIIEPAPVQNAPGPFVVPCSLTVEAARLSARD